MVTAGVYLIARMHPLFEHAPAAAAVGVLLIVVLAGVVGAGYLRGSETEGGNRDTCGDEACCPRVHGGHGSPFVVAPDNPGPDRVRPSLHPGPVRRPTLDL